MWTRTYPRYVAVRRGLHGMGQSGDYGGETGSAPVDPSAPIDVTSHPVYTPTYGIPTLPSTGTNTASSGGGTPPTPINWTAIAQSIIQGTAKVVQLSQLTNMPAGSYYQQTPQGAIIASTAGIPGSASAALNSSGLTGMMPLLLVGGGLVLLMMMGSRR